MGKRMHSCSSTAPIFFINIVYANMYVCRQYLIYAKVSYFLLNRRAIEVKSYLSILCYYSNNKIGKKKTFDYHPIYCITFDRKSYKGFKLPVNQPICFR